MDELDVFRGFRADVVAPSEAAEQRAAVRLTRAIERPPGRGARLQRLARQRPGRTTLALAVLAGAAFAALSVGSPWKSSPGLLERAEAALTPPAGTVLHMKWEVTRTSTDFGCSVTTGPNEMWIDQTEPYQYRLIDHGFRPEAADRPRASACAGNGPTEYGGTLRPPQSVTFVPPNTLERRRFGFGAPSDFVQMLREAIANGTAHDDGRTQLDGREVERIRMPPAPCPPSLDALKPPCPPPRPFYAYMDPETFLPIQIDMPNGIASIVDGQVYRFHIVERYLTYEYLPRTAANLALTDIRAQHPGATGP
jgi:hypothetical protein